MNNLSIKDMIIRKFNESGETAIIPLMKSDDVFTASYYDEGIQVSNLGSQGFLPWEVFSEIIKLLNRIGGKAIKGDAMNGKLGDSKLPIDSIEGYIAYKVYGKSLGDTVFRRISPICGILAWAEICINERGKLRLASTPQMSIERR